MIFKYLIVFALAAFGLIFLRVTFNGPAERKPLSQLRAEYAAAGIDYDTVFVLFGAILSMVVLSAAVMLMIGV